MSKAADLANLIGNIDLSSSANSFKTLDNLNNGGGGVNKNFIINGAMNVAQRGTSATGVGGSTGYFTCDRWKFAQGTNTGRLTMTQDSSAPSGFANSLKLACTTTDTSIAATEAGLIQQIIEGQNLQAFAKGTADAKPFVLSFYVKGNASATYTAELYDNDNSRSNGQTFSVTTDWTRVELTYPADTTGAFDDDNAASLYFNIWLHVGTNWTGGTFTNGTWTAVSNNNQRVGDGSSFFDSTDRTFFITGVQLEIGQNPTEFEFEPVDVTRNKCYRYYYQSTTYPLSLANAHDAGYSFRQERTQQISLPAIMRTSPTITGVESAKLLNSGTIAFHSAADFVMVKPTSHAGDLPSSEYWYGGYKADAEL